MRTIYRDVTTHQQKDKKTNELSLSKFLRHQRIILHGYEERSLKDLPKIVYRTCERILLLSNCWCNEFAIGNVPFTNNFLVTKLNFINRKNSCVSAQDTETGSQQTLSNNSNKGINVMSPTELSARSNGDSSISENGDRTSSVPVSTTASSTELLNDLNGGNLRENKCFQLLSQLQCGSAHELAEPHSIQEVAEALLADHNALDESTKKYIRLFEIDFNCSQATWLRLKSEKKLVILSGLLYDWIESLKYPVINREDLSNIVIYNKRPETCLQKLNIDSQYLLEFLIRFLIHLQPMETATTLHLLKRFAASLTQKTVLIKNSRLPVGKEFQKLRDGTLECVLNFMFSLYNMIEANRSSSAVSAKFYEICSGSSEMPSPDETDDDSDVECPVP